MRPNHRLLWFAPFILIAFGAGCTNPTLEKIATKLPLGQPTEPDYRLKFDRRNMLLFSPAFENNQPIPAKYTCDGANINPPLIFHYVPAEAKSLVLIMDDPDAPNGDWTHWTIWNIDPKELGIPENGAPPRAVQGTTDFSRTGYGGPCPPLDTHRYQFKLYALDTLLNLPTAAKKPDIERAIGGHVLATAHLTGVYQRQKK